MIYDLEIFSAKLEEIFGSKWDPTEAENLFKGYLTASVFDALDATSATKEEKEQLKGRFFEEETRDDAGKRVAELTGELSSEIKAQIALQSLKRVLIALVQNLPANMADQQRKLELEAKIESLTD